MDEKKLNEAIASLLKDKSVPAREALAEMIVEFIQPNHITTNFVGMLLNTRALKPGDMLFKKLRKGIKVRTLVPGSIHLAESGNWKVDRLVQLTKSVGKCMLSFLISIRTKSTQSYRLCGQLQTLPLTLLT
jgi:hypothetical protein